MANGYIVNITSALTWQKEPRHVQYQAGPFSQGVKGMSNSHFNELKTELVYCNMGKRVGYEPGKKYVRIALEPWNAFPSHRKSHCLIIIEPKYYADLKKKVN